MVQKYRDEFNKELEDLKKFLLDYKDKLISIDPSCYTSSKGSNRYLDKYDENIFNVEPIDLKESEEITAAYHNIAFSEIKSCIDEDFQKLKVIYFSLFF